MDRNGIWNGAKQEFDTGDPDHNFYVFNVCGDMIPASGYQSEKTWYRQEFDDVTGSWIFHTLALSTVNGNATYYLDFYPNNPGYCDNSRYYTITEAGNSYYRPFINEITKSGLLMGYYGYRTLWIHSVNWTSGAINYFNFPNNTWLKIFNGKPADQHTFQNLVNTLPSSTNIGNETIILGQTNNAPNNYTPGGVFLDMEIWDDAETHLYYRNNLYKWDKPVSAAQGQDPSTGHETCNWTTVCQWTGGSYDPSGHAAWLNFFVRKGDKLKLKFNIYCRGRTWDNNLHFCEGNANASMKENNVMAMRSWLAMVPDDLQVY